MHSSVYIEKVVRHMSGYSSKKESPVRLTRVKSGFVVLAAIAVVAGVSLIGQDARTPAPSKHVISLSIAKEYKTLASLQRDADVVALVSVVGEPNPSKRLADIPTVDVRLHVEQVFAGMAQTGDTITLVQYGDPSGQITVEDSIPILQDGKRYVVFLNRQFPDQPQMFLTGQAGVFEAGTGTEFYRLGDVSADLPKSLSLNQL